MTNFDPYQQYPPPNQPPSQPPIQPPSQPLNEPAKPRHRLRLTATIAATAVLAAGTGAATTTLLNNDDGTTPSTATGSTTPTAEQAANSTSSNDVSAIADKAVPSVVEIKITTPYGESLGSGVILTEDGRILTNAHVVSEAANGGTIEVTFSDGKTATATVVGSNSDADLAVIQAQDVSGLTPASLGDSSTIEVGDEVVAIGSPEGLQSTVTSGIVSYLGRKVTVPTSESNPQSDFPFGERQQQSMTSYDAVQTDASINPGNSGGPLLNSSGQVIGINSAIYSPTAATGSAGSVGLGFAIPINTAKQVVSQILAESGSES